jgi:hypothetical protein
LYHATVVLYFAHLCVQPSWAFSALSGAAGGVLLAKTATGELAWGDVWFNGITTRNPWNINTGSCGSSAGSAVAVAAGELFGSRLQLAGPSCNMSGAFLDDLHCVVAACNIVLHHSFCLLHSVRCMY